MTLDTEIRLAGALVNIKRTPRDIQTYLYHGHIGSIGGTRRVDPGSEHQAGYYLPAGSGAVSGDIIQIGNVYYLIVTLLDVYFNGEIVCLRGTLYRCNAVVSLYKYNSVTKKPDTLVGSGLHCVVTQESSYGLNEDKAMVVNQYRGTSIPFNIYMRESDGLTKDVRLLIDQHQRRFRILNDFNPYLADGVVQTQASWEVS